MSSSYVQSVHLSLDERLLTSLAWYRAKVLVSSNNSK